MRHRRIAAVMLGALAFATPAVGQSAIGGYWVADSVTDRSIIRHAWNPVAHNCTFLGFEEAVGMGHGNETWGRFYTSSTTMYDSVTTSNSTYIGPY